MLQEKSTYTLVAAVTANKNRWFADNMVFTQATVYHLRGFPTCEGVSARRTLRHFMLPQEMLLPCRLAQIQVLWVTDIVHRVLQGHTVPCGGVWCYTLTLYTFNVFVGEPSACFLSSANSYGRAIGQRGQFEVARS